MQEADDIPGAIGDLLRLGLIASVDLAAATAVVHCGEIESPPLPWLELAGTFRTWTPPTEGEQVLLICPEADIAHGLILRGINSTRFPPPASDDSHQLHGKDGLIIRVTADGLEITAPGDVDITGNVTISGDLSVDGNGSITGDMQVDGRANADEDVTGGGISLKNHTHSGVTSGGSTTAPPQ